MVIVSTIASGGVVIATALWKPKNFSGDRSSSFKGVGKTIANMRWAPDAREER